MKRLRYAWLPAALLFTGLLQAQSVELQVELMNQIGTDTSRKGDMVSGRVITPTQLQGDVVEGKITESKSGAKLGGQSAFSFSFDTLRHNGTAIPINSQFKSAVNSKGKPNVDEEGRMVRRGTGNVAKVGAGTGAGALIGGLTRGGKGAAIGAAVGAAASIVLVEIAADGPNIRFSPGSRLVIEANSRSGTPLRSLASAAPPSAPAPPSPAPAPTAVAPPQPQAVAPSSPQPEFTTLKSAFVPGERTIFFDDFTDMGPGDAPPHWKTRGAAPELRASGNLRQLTVTANGSILPNLASLPKNFTCETEIKVDAPRRIIANMVFSAKDREVLHWTTYIEAAQTDQVVSMRAPYQELGRKRIPMSWNEPVKMALWIQNGRLRVFINGEKHLDFNQVDLSEITKVEITQRPEWRQQPGARLSLGPLRRVGAGLQPGDHFLRPLRDAWHPVRHR